MDPASERGRREPPATDEDGIARYIAAGTAANYVGQFMVLAVWFFLTPFILHTLGATQYGLWVLVASVLAYGQLFDLGINNAVAKYTAEFRARGDDQTTSSLIATALWLYIALGLLVAVIGIVLAPALVSILNVPAGEHSTAVTLVRVTAIGVAIDLPAGTAYAVLRGLHRFDLVNIITSIGMLVLAVVTVAVLKLGGDVVAMSVAVIPITLLWQIVAIGFIRRNAPGLRFGFGGASRRHVREVTSFGGALFGINVAETVKSRSSELVIGAVLPVAAVAPFSVARRVSELPELLTSQFVSVLLPLSSKLSAEGRAELLRGIYVAATRIALAVFAAIAIPVIVYAHELLTAWVGPRYSGDAIVLVILAVAGFAKVATLPSLLMLQGIDRHRPLVVFAVGAAVLNIALAIPLAHSNGVKGVAYATLIALAAELAAAVPYGVRTLRVPVRELLARALAPTILCGIPAAALALLLRGALAPDTLLSVGLVAIPPVVLFGLIYLLLPQTGRERAFLRRALAALGSRRRGGQPSAVAEVEQGAAGLAGDPPDRPGAA